MSKKYKVGSLIQWAGKEFYIGIIIGINCCGYITYRVLWFDNLDYNHGTRFIKLWKENE